MRRPLLPPQQRRATHPQMAQHTLTRVWVKPSARLMELHKIENETVRKGDEIILKAPAAITCICDDTFYGQDDWFTSAPPIAVMLCYEPPEKTSKRIIEKLRDSQNGIDAEMRNFIQSLPITRFHGYKHLTRQGIIPHKLK